MSILIKLVGCGNALEMRKEMQGKFGLKEIESILEELGFDAEEIKGIKIISNAKDLRNEENKDFIFEEPDSTVFIFTTIADIKQKLIKAFDKDSINKEIEIEEPDKNPVLDEATATKINMKIIELFRKDNFKKLVDIWLNEPDIFKEFFRYINSGNIVNIDIPENSKDKMFEDEIKIIKEVGINKSDEEILQVMKLYNGQLNFVLRDLLTRL
jgi:hypothetical protein